MQRQPFKNLTSRESNRRRLASLAIACLLAAAWVGLSLTDGAEMEPASQHTNDASSVLEEWDPQSENWSVEQRSQLAASQLKRLGRALREPDAARRHRALKALFIERASVRLSTAVDSPTKRSDQATLPNWLAEMDRGFEDWRGQHVHAKAKIIGVETLAEQKWKTRVRFELWQDQPTPREQSAVWEVEWRPQPPLTQPRIVGLAEIKSQTFEDQSVWFSDVSSGVLGERLAGDDRLRLGAEHWDQFLDRLGERNLMGHHGIAVGDVNADGLEDLYVALGTGLPNLLLVAKPDGTVVDRAVEAGVAWLDDTKGVLFIDSDNDGDQDLLLALGSTLVLAKNDGQGMFEKFVRMKAPGSAAFYSIAAADFDLDGDLDFYGTRYVEQQYAVSIPVPFHDANNGPSNHLLRNDGDDRYTDVTTAVGLDIHNRRFSLAATFTDYDADGDPDLYVANDFGRNNLYRNDSGRFVDVARELGVEDQAAGMGSSWSDFDLDGDLDLLVTNMYSAAGRRIAFDDAFQPSLDAKERSEIRRHSLGNSLFQASDKGTFVDVADRAGVRMGRWGWGALFSDFNNDGFDDIVAPNGFVTGAREHDL